MSLILDPHAPPRTCYGCGCTDEHGCPVISASGIVGARCHWVTPSYLVDGDLCSSCAPKAVELMFNETMQAFVEGAVLRTTSHTWAELLEAYQLQGYVPTFRFDWGDGRDDERLLVADVWDLMMLSNGHVGVRCHRLEVGSTAGSTDQLQLELEGGAS